MDENSAPGPEPIPPASSSSVPPPEGAGAPPPQSLPPQSSSVIPPSPVIPSTKEERLWATLIHLSGIVGMCFTVYMVPGHVLLPLIIWLLKRDGSAFIDDQGKEALNFQITMTIVGLIFFILVFVCVGIVLLSGLGVYMVIIQIIAAIKANDGMAYRYPFIFRLVN